jgi:hypothetical protein
MPLPIIPILQSGPTYPGKQAIIKYLMLIPTPNIVHNEEVKRIAYFHFFFIVEIHLVDA